MSNIYDAFPKKYLCAADLRGTKPTVTIAHVEFDDIGHGTKQERKPVVTFVANETTFPHNEKMSVGDRAEILRALEKQWVLNKTNADTLVELFGTSDFDQWPGRRLELFSTKVDYQGRRMDGLRCGAAPTPKKKTNGSKPPAPPVDSADDTDDDPDDDVGF